MKKIKILSLITASAVFLSGCTVMQLTDSGYRGYKSNELKFGNVTKQFQHAVSRANVEWLDEIIASYPDYDINYYSDTKSQYSGYDYETLKIVISSFNLNITDANRNNMLECLLGNGLNPNIKFSNGHYALDLVCADYNDRPFLLKTMLEYGADPTNANTAGFYNVDLGNSNKDELYLPIYWGIYKPIYTNAEDLLGNGAVVSYAMLEQLRDKYTTLNGSAKSYQMAFKSYIETEKSLFTKAEEYAVLGESDKLITELKSGYELDDSTAVFVRYFICRFCNVEALKVWNEIYSERNIREDRNYKYKSVNSLSAAASEGNYEIVKYLIDVGEVKLPYEISYKEPLVYAAQAGSYDVCEILLDNDYYIDANDCDDIIKAAYQGQDIETFRLLANYFKGKNILTEFTLYNAFENLPVEWNDFTKGVIDCLIDECGLTLQLFPIIDTDFETVEYLFEKGKPLSVVDLPCAIISKDSRTVKLVLDMGADPNQYSYRGHLRLAYLNNIEKMLMPYDEFLEWDKLNNIDKDESSLHLSVLYGTSDIVKILIEYGMNVDDDMALYMAINDSSKATFDVLYNAGASLDYKNDEDKETLLDVAKRMGRDDIVKILKDAGVKAYKAL